LVKIRKNGYAYDLEEHEPHVRCIAAPVWDHSGAVNASLSVTGPAVRMSLARLRQIAPLVRRAGMEISRELGYKAESPVAGSLARPEPRGVQPVRRARIASK
jgi:DNA-binding IclR family transcriptional regulator